MGANQSSRSQLGAAQHHVGGGGGTLGNVRQLNKQHKHSASLSSSLRKSVSNVLAANKLSAKSIKSSPLNDSNSNGKLAKTRLPGIVIGGADELEGIGGGGGESAHLNQSADPYYVSSERQHVSGFASKSGRMVVPAASCANNYVAMQQAIATPGELEFCDAQLDDPEFDGGFGNCRLTYGGSGASFTGTGGHFYAAAEQQLAEPNPVRDGSFINGVQDQHHRKQQQQHHNHIHHQLEHLNMGALSRSSQVKQQQQPNQQTSGEQQPFVHLARAVNTKTKRVLNNSNVSMPNGNVSGGNYGRRQHYPAADNNNNNGTSSLLTQNSPQQPGQHQGRSTQHSSSTSGRKSGPYLSSNQSSAARYSSPSSLAYQSGQANEQSAALFNLSHSSSSPLCHKQQQPRSQQNTRPGFEDSENCFQVSSPNYHQYYLSNCLLNPHQTDLDQQQHLQMSGYGQPYGAQYRPNQQQVLAQLDFHQPSRQQQQLAKGQISDQLTLDCRNYTRSHSFGGAGAGSRTLDSKKKNPFAALFQNNSAKANHSNTIHLGRRNKSSILPNFGNNSNNNNAATRDNQRSCPGSLKRIKPAPLTAQQASYEAMRTIDMYLIRQIARSCMDFEMEQKIDLEIRLRELAAQSMLEARDEIDVLEVEKSLLTSDQRMNCYASLLEERRKQLSNPSLSTVDSGRGSKSGNQLNHRIPSHRPDVIGANGTAATATSGVASSPSFSSSVSNSQSPSKLSPVSGESANSPSFTTNSSQHSRQVGLRSQSSARNNGTLCAKQRAKNKQRESLMQSITSLSNINCNMVITSRASVSISEIRIPLMWRDVDHFKNRGDYKRFAIFCLLKIDSQIYDTQLICDVDRQVTDVTFDDLVVFNEIDHNFELTLEVYTCVYLEQFSLSSTPRKLKEKLTSSVSRAMGRRLATQTASINYTKELQAYDKSYRFALIANATLRLCDASSTVKTYDLVLVSPSAHHRHYHGNPAGRNNGPDQPTDSVSSANSKDVDKNTLPLFGHFCCKLLVRPDVFDKNIKTGYLRVATISMPNHNNNTIGSAHNSHSGSSDRVSDSPLNTTTDGSLDVITDSAARLRSTLAAASSKTATLSMSTSRVHWGLLRNFALYLWPIDDRDLELALQRGELPLLESPHKPRLTLAIDKYARLLRVSNSSLTIETDKGCFVLGVYWPESSLNGEAGGGTMLNQADEMSHWLRSIEQLIYDSHIWGSVLSHYPPHTKSSTSTRSSGNNNKRTTTASKQKHHYAGGNAMLQADL